MKSVINGSKANDLTVLPWKSTLLFSMAFFTNKQTAHQQTDQSGTQQFPHNPATALPGDPARPGLPVR